MKNFRSHFVFSRSQQNGIFLLVLIIVILQLIYFFVDFNHFTPEEQDSEELQAYQKKIDSLRASSARADSVKVFPFNPNFITDYKGYTLGMSIEEIDRLHAWRSLDKWVNSAKEFQNVTGVSDSLLQKISPLFRFPDWITKPKFNSIQTTPAKAVNESKLDLNAATVQDLINVQGIGEILAGRIINYRNKIGGFKSDIQLKDVFGLNYEARSNLELRFTVKSQPDIPVYNINTATVLELSSIPYLNYELAREIVNYRLLHEGIKSFEELARIKEFPSEKIDRIALYLTLE